LRTFITSCLTGRITDPVIRKRTIRVATITIASAMGACVSRLCWRSTKWAAAPATSTCEPGGSGNSRILLDRIAARVGDVALGRIGRDHRVSVGETLRRLDLATPFTDATSRSIV